MSDKITIVSVCYSRNEQLKKVLPSWLAQKDINFDILILVGPDVEQIEHPKVHYITYNAAFPGTGVLWNLLYMTARSPLIYTAYSDMVLQDKRYIARLLEYYKPNSIVNRQLVRADGSLDEGLWCCGFLTSAELIAKVGGWDVQYGTGYGWEDTDFMHRLVEAGGKLTILKPLPKYLSLRHIDHDSVRDAKDWTEKYVRNKDIYNSRFPAKTLMGLYRDNKFEVIDDQYS